MAFFVAFYSYKGGVGRTLALANVGYSLAARGKRVVLVDMDLEAPGLGRFEEFGYTGRKSNPLGFLDYAAKYRETGECPKIDRYVHECRPVDGDGTLWRMPSGRTGPKYQEKLGRLPWKRLHEYQGTRPFVEALRENLETTLRPHYVLIDSRTGLSDIGGLSTHLLADSVVLVTNLTVECIEGSAKACEAFLHPDTRPQQVHLLASPVPPVASDGESLVDQRLGLVRETMPGAVSFGRDVFRVEYDPQMVLSPALAVRHPRRLQAAPRYEELREQIQRSNPEEVFPVVEEARRLRGDGDLEAGLELLHRFAEEHPDNAEGFLEWGAMLLESGRHREAAEAFRRSVAVAPEFALAHRRLGEALHASGDHASAVESLERARDLGEDGQRLYQALAAAYGAQGKVHEQAEAGQKAVARALGSIPTAKPPEREQLAKMRRQFIDAMSARPPYFGFDPERFWDLVLGSTSLPSEGKLGIVGSVSDGRMSASEIHSLLQTFETERVYHAKWIGASGAEFQRRLAESLIDPSDREALSDLLESNVGDVGVLQWIAAATPDPDEKQEWLEQIRQRYAAAREQKEGKQPEGALHWGSVLGQLADLASGSEEKRSLLEEACDRCEEAIRHKPDQHEALFNCGVVLGKLADLASDSGEKRSLLEEACGRCEEAVRHKPDHHEGLFNWGIALGKLADLASGSEEKCSLLEAACGRYEEAVRQNPGVPKVIDSLASNRLRLAALSPRDKADLLAREAVGLCEQANQIQPHSADYNLACAFSRLGQFGAADELLAGDLIRRSRMRQHALDDSDFETLWSERPDLREAIEESLDLGDDTTPIERWLESRRADEAT